MKKQLLIALLACISITAQANPGDTTVVQCFTFGSVQDSLFNFPSLNLSTHKVLMLYTLKCNPAQNPACGEWDYLTYTYVYKKTGEKDSTVASIDTTFDGNGGIVAIDTAWNVFWAEERFEIGRYITPYGIGLSMGSGITWVFDVTDYRSILTDSLRLTAGNWQELLDLKFLFIEGTPVREVRKVENLWVGQPAYGNNPSIETFLSPKTLFVPNLAENTLLKMRVTGHGFGGTDNCAEFCPRNHSIWVDGTKRYERLVWRDNCDLNPLYPQGGTWVYDRTNWCPGAEVETYDVDITPYVTPGTGANLDYNVEPYTWDGQGSVPYYAIETQAVFLGGPNFTLDATLEDVVSPSTKFEHKRLNPICSEPIVKIKNTGSTPLTSLTITYGIVNGTPQTYQWQGNLPFLKTETVKLPAFFFDGAGPGNYNFYATVSSPNGGVDEYEFNNRIQTTFEATPKLNESQFVIRLKTNTQGWQNRWELRDKGGNILYSRDNCNNNTTYNDTVNLTPGCYTFELWDEGEDGLAWWANNDGSGFIRFFKLAGNPLKSFDPDFGGRVYYNFTVGTMVGYTETPMANVNVYPNPTTGQVYIQLPDVLTTTTPLNIYNTTGQVVYTQQLSPNTGADVELSLTHLPNGLYYLTLGNTTHKIHITK